MILYVKTRVFKVHDVRRLITANSKLSKHNLFFVGLLYTAVHVSRVTILVFAISARAKQKGKRNEERVGKKKQAVILVKSVSVSFGPAGKFVRVTYARIFRGLTHRHTRVERYYLLDWKIYSCS